MKKEIETLAELKGEEVRLRNVLDSGGRTPNALKEYWKVRAKVEIVESVLLWTIVSLMLIFVGCQTLKGAMGDSAWLIQKGADNINVQEK